MKKTLLFALIPIVLLLSGCFRPEDSKFVDLSKEWKFMPGDDTSWRMPSFDDSKWALIKPDQIWERQGYKGLDEFSWYRIRVIIPSRLRDKSIMKDSLQIKLGRIDDCDQVFLNGELIGENGKTLPPGSKITDGFAGVEGKWNLERRYILPVGDTRIHWDNENVIAVRVRDTGGAGGMFSKPFAVAMVDLEDYITFNFASKGFTYYGDSLMNQSFFVTNQSKTADFQGILNIRLISCENGNIISDKDTLLSLVRNSSSEFFIEVRNDMSTPFKAEIKFIEGASGGCVSETLELPYILTPPAPKEPRINGSRVFGVTQYKPFLYKVAATGEAPLRYFAQNLPRTLSINEESGLITGYMPKKGSYTIELCVENPRGTCERELRIEVGDLIALTPPLGWNSWNCWGLSVSDAKVRSSAEYMKSSGLIDHGWTYINIDDGWEDTHKDGKIVTNAKFPDMKALSNYVHSLGLKIGIYSSPGPKTCGGYEGSYTFEEADAKSYAEWGIDYLKYDWCSYYQIAPKPTLEQMKHPYKVMKKHLRATNRDIYYSLCQYGMGDVWTWGAEVDGNSWRTTGDIEDTWESMSGIGFSQDKCSPYAAPGRWNDPDMLVVGWVGWGPALHYTRLTPNEQYTHITLWSLLASPLLIGCDLSRLDPFTLNLLTNDEVLAVNQDPLGKQARKIQANDQWQVWAKEMEDGSMAVGLFNMTTETVFVPVEMRLLSLKGKHAIRDLWKQQDLGKVETQFEMKVQPHGARMIILRPVR